MKFVEYTTSMSWSQPVDRQRKLEITEAQFNIYLNLHNEARPEGVSPSEDPYLPIKSPVGVNFHEQHALKIPYYFC